MAFDKVPRSSKAEYDRSGEAHSFELWDKYFAEANAGNFTPTIERNEKGEILAPNGMISRLPNEDFVKVTRTPTFKKWFGDWVNDPTNSSKVVYENTGEPMVVYHGITDKVPSIESGLGEGNRSIWLTDTKNNALFWSKILNHKPDLGGLIFSCFLNFRQPLLLQADPSSDDLTFVKIGREFKEHDYDSIFQRDGDVGMGSFRCEQYVAVSKSQLMHLPSDIEQNRKLGM